jgi:protein ImuB
MRRVVSLWLPRLATDIARRRDPTPLDDRPAPLVTTAETGGRAVVVAVDDAAAFGGIEPGMGLTDARALSRGLRALSADPTGDKRVLEGLADWCARYSPSVALAGADGLYIDATGCAHLLGGEAPMLADLLRRVRASGLTCHAAMADTPGSAWAVSRFAAASEGAVIPRGETRESLSPLPVAASRLPSETVTALARAGLRRIADLLDMERTSGRAPLAARFGPKVWQRLDLALGRLDEPISPRQPVAPYAERIAFAEPIATPEDLARTTRLLLDKLAARLAREGRGARQIEIAFHRVDGAVERVWAGTAEPSRDPVHLFRLLRDKLETVEPGFGVDLAVLSISLTEAMEETQFALPDAVGPGLQPGATSLTELVDRLGNRLGAGNVWRYAPCESHLPERAAAKVAPLSPPSPVKWRLPQRPTRLFARPERINVEARGDDAPVLFLWRGHIHHIRVAEGPEPIDPEWWRGGADKAERRYWRVEAQTGERFWLFRAVGADGAWFLHGEFA